MNRILEQPRIMEVTVKLLVGLQKYSPTGKPEFTLDVDKQATIGSILDILGLPSRPRCVCLLNGRQADPDQHLHKHDTLAVFPSMEGG